jgi:hypothetical protein
MSTIFVVVFRLVKRITPIIAGLAAILGVYLQAADFSERRNAVISANCLWIPISGDQPSFDPFRKTSIKHFGESLSNDLSQFSAERNLPQDVAAGIQTRISDSFAKQAAINEQVAVRSLALLFCGIQNMSDTELKSVRIFLGHNPIAVVAGGNLLYQTTQTTKLRDEPEKRSFDLPSFAPGEYVQLRIYTPDYIDPRVLAKISLTANDKKGTVEWSKYVSGAELKAAHILSLLASPLVIASLLVLTAILIFINRKSGESKGAASKINNDEQG